MIKPIGSYVLVQPAVKSTTTNSGFVIASEAEKIAVRGTILAVGEDTEGVVVGEEVVFRSYAHEEIEWEGVAYYLVPEDSILAKII